MATAALARDVDERTSTVDDVRRTIGRPAGPDLPLPDVARHCGATVRATVDVTPRGTALVTVPPAPAQEEPDAGT